MSVRLPICLLALALAVPASAQTATRFSFQGEASDHVAVAPDIRYDSERGYGWEDSGRFSVRVPEGNYRVSLVLGGAAPSETTVRAEGRRLMLEGVRTARGRAITGSF